MSLPAHIVFCVKHSQCIYIQIIYYLLVHGKEDKMSPKGRKRMFFDGPNKILVFMK
jgi:hypothetical protein